MIYVLGNEDKKSLDIEVEEKFVYGVENLKLTAFIIKYVLGIEEQKFIYSIVYENAPGIENQNAFTIEAKNVHSCLEVFDINVNWEVLNSNKILAWCSWTHAYDTILVKYIKGLFSHSFRSSWIFLASSCLLDYIEASTSLYLLTVVSSIASTCL